MDTATLLRRLHSLSVFRALYDQPLFHAVLSLVKALERRDTSAALSAWGEFFSRLDESGFHRLDA